MPKLLTTLFVLLLFPSLFQSVTNPHPKTVKITTPTSSPASTKDQAILDAEEDSLDHVVYYDDIIAINERSKKDAKIWDHWGKWSACSVSCGVGKMTRWRHCVSQGCAPGEKEAQIKTCTLSPC